MRTSTSARRAPAYIEARPTYVGINAIYKPLVYTRPVIEVEPPSGWIGARVDLVPAAVVVEAPPPVVVEPPRGRAVVGVGVDVHIPVPTIRSYRRRRLRRRSEP